MQVEKLKQNPRVVELGRRFIKVSIPQDWDVLKLGTIASVNGRIGWKGLTADEYVEDGPIMLSVWSLVENTSYGIDYEIETIRLSKFRYDESPEIQLKPNDVLVSKDGDIGRIGFVKQLPEPATVNSHIVVVRSKNKKINNEFLFHYFRGNSFQRYCIAMTSGTTVPLFSQKNLKNTPISIPDIKEQEKIADILSRLDNQIQKTQDIVGLQQKIIDKHKTIYLARLRKGLRQKLLTGQIRVNV